VFIRAQERAVRKRVERNVVVSSFIEILTFLMAENSSLCLLLLEALPGAALLELLLLTIAMKSCQPAGVCNLGRD
jgi:hypothetical protein